MNITIIQTILYEKNDRLKSLLDLRCRYQHIRPEVAFYDLTRRNGVAFGGILLRGRFTPPPPPPTTGVFC